MISKASELLELFIKEETKKLEGIKMPHMPTLGTAYEEVTKQGIDKNFSIPKKLDLSVVSGFVSIGGEVLPEQIDCMLVHGSGERYGLTQQYFFDIENVLCIFEVKKNLTKADYIDAMEHLAKIRRKFADHFEHKLVNEGFEPDINLAKKIFSQLTGKVAPETYMDIHGLSKPDGLLFYSLVQETLAPISIIHGYGGYKTESGLRKVFIDILEEKKKSTNTGVGIPSIPTLVTSNTFCIVKGNGMPFIPIRHDDEWVAAFSTRHNSAKLILELIWSKISYYFDMKMPWNDGLHMDNIAPLLLAKAACVDGDLGWIYNSIELNERRLNREDESVWEPAPLMKAEISAINIMAMQGGYLSLDGGMDLYLKDNHKTTLEEVCRKLILTRLFMKDGEYIRPIHHHTYILTLDDENGYASSERERFDIWCEENGLETNYMAIVFLD